MFVFGFLTDPKFWFRRVFKKYFIPSVHLQEIRQQVVLERAFLSCEVLLLQTLRVPDTLAPTDSLTFRIETRGNMETSIHFWMA